MASVRACRLGVWGAAWVCLALAGSRAEAPVLREDTDEGKVVALDAIGQALLGARLGQAGPERVRQDLERAGVADLYGALRAGHFRVKIGGRGRSARVLDQRERAWLSAAFLGQSRRERQAFLDGRLEADPDAQERIVALELLGASVTVSELEELAEWSDPGVGQDRVDARVRTAFGAALAATMRRLPETVDAVPRLMERAHLSLLPAALDALAGGGQARALDALGRLLGGRDAVNVLVLVEMGQLARVLPHPIDPGVRARARSFLVAADRSVLLEAIKAVEYMDDQEAIASLLEILSGGDMAAGERAHRALVSITGQHLPPRPEAWTDWYRGAMEWWQGEAQDDLQALFDEDNASRSRILMELSKRRVHRHGIAERIAPLLTRDDSTLAVLACAVLGHLGSALSTHALIDALASPNVELKRAAYLALCRISGSDHGEDPNAWEAAGW